MAKKTDEEIKTLKDEMEFKAEYDLGRPFKDRPLDAERFGGFLNALRWVLGEEPGDGRKIVCQDKATCQFGKECDGGWDSVDPQTGRLCRDALRRNFEKIQPS